MFWDYEAAFNGVVDDVQNGKYGEEWKRELEKSPNLAVSISDEIYVCPGCGYFTTDLNLSLYKPKKRLFSTAPATHKRYGFTLELDSAPGYRLYRKYPHPCIKCNKQMEARNPQKDKTKPACPQCGQRGKFREGDFWD